MQKISLTLADFFYKKPTHFIQLMVTLLKAELPMKAGKINGKTGKIHGLLAESQ